MAPKTVDNFINLCLGYQTEGKTEIGYVGSEVHRIVKGMFVQAGRINTKNSNEGTSIYSGEFEDESFQVKHTEIGLLGMCKRNGQKHTNESQFYITTGAPLTFLDGNNVVFGRVISGMRAIKVIEKMETLNERPNDVVKICSAGIYEK